MSAQPRRPGIVAALPSEARALARLRPRGATKLPSGARLVLSGIGASRARVAARRLVGEGVDGLVSWGSAAALVPELAPGDLLLPQAVITADDRRYAIDPDWRVALAGMIGQCVHLRDGALVESRHVINEIAAKRRLHTASGAHACDMESAAVAAVAAEFRLPFIAIRAIVDDATMILPPSARAAVDADGALRPLALLCSLAGRPSAVHAQLRALKQLAVAFRAAQLTLAAVAPILREE